MSEAADEPSTPPDRIPIKVSSHPLRTGEPGVLTQLPMGEVEKRYVLVKSILEDIGRMIDVANEQKDTYNKRLLGKFIVIELLNFQENVRKLYNAINRDPAMAQVPREAKAAFEAAFDKQPRFKALRDKLAAHRDDDLGLLDAMTLWDSMMTVSLNEVITACYAFFNAISNSNVRRFHWYAHDGGKGSSEPRRARIASPSTPDEAADPRRT